MLIDLHTHTRPHSADSTLDPDDLIERSKRAGLDGICFSDHDYFWDPEDVYALGRRHNYLVLPAGELNTGHGHMLCYGIHKYVFGMHNWWELAQHLQDAGGVMVAAHPFRRQMPWDAKLPEEYEEALAKAALNPAYAACVALEAMNGKGVERENEFSARLCERLGMAATGGSDAHFRVEVGTYATQFENRIENLEGLIAELKAGRFRPAKLSPVQIEAKQEA